MKFNYLRFFIIFFFSYPLFAQITSPFQYSPSKPTPQDKIDITFNSVGTSLENVENLEVEVIFLSNKLELIKTIKLSKIDKVWKGVIEPTLTTSVIAMKFISGNVEESNSGRGYFICLHETDGNPIVKSFAAKALLYTSVGGFVGIDVDLKQANKIFEEAFLKYPSLKPEFLNDYLNTLNTVILDKKELDSRILKELESIEQKNELSDNEFYTLYQWYNKLKQVEKVNSVSSKAKIKYPYGLVAADLALIQILGENNFDKKLTLIEKYITDFNKNNNFEGSLDNIFFGTLGQNNIKNAIVLLSKYSNTFKPTHYINLTSTMLRSNYNADTTLVWILESIKLAENELTSPKSQKPKIFSDFLWLKVRESTYSFALNTYAEYLSKHNNTTEAIINYEKSLNYFYHKWLTPQLLMGYFQLLTKGKMYDKAIEKITNYMAQGIVTDEIKELLKENYIGKNGSDSGYNEFLEETLNTFKKQLIARLEKEVLDQTAPQFTLLDLEGKKISLSDYSGKVIVLDFWATWCGPCIASFPAMKMALDKYEKNGDVKFLFINTQETAENKREYVKEFMAKKNFTFHVLLDENNEVLSKYKVVGVPTKFVIDKKGKIKFKSTGYFGKLDEFVEEIGVMIELASK